MSSCIHCGSECNERVGFCSDACVAARVQEVNAAAEGYPSAYDGLKARVAELAAEVERLRELSGCTTFASMSLEDDDGDSSRMAAVKAIAKLAVVYRLTARPRVAAELERIVDYLLAEEAERRHVPKEKP
jgi:hypothetical protein